MPFQGGVYYPFTTDHQGAQSSAGIPSLLTSPLSQYSANVPPGPPAAMTPSSGTSGIQPFKFRPRCESVDWRRINAVDVDLVASRLDVDVLQENINTVTFCNLEGERCQRCHSPVDPVLIKLLRLAQLTVEWALHCQEVLALNLRAAEERLEAGGRERRELLELRSKQEEKVKTMEAELKQRKKIIKTQQTMLVPRIISGQKCSHCEKSFLNSTFLQSHMQRRHPDEHENRLRSDGENKSVIDNLKLEISSQKEQITQLQQTLQGKAVQCVHCDKTFLSSSFLQSHIQRRHPDEHENQGEKKSAIENLRLENINQKEQILQLQQNLQAKTSLENELQSMHKELMKELERLKAEEMTRNIQALNEANQNLTSRHEKSTGSVQPERDLDIYKELQDQAMLKLEQQLKKQEKKMESRLQEIKAQHGSEKNQLLKDLSKMQSSVFRLQQERSQWQQQHQQEAEKRLQEKEHSLQTQRKQMRNVSLKPPTKVVEAAVSTAAPEPKPKRVVLEEPVFAFNLDPIQELTEEERDSSSLSERRPVEKKAEPLRGRRQKVNSSSLKKDPRMKKEIRKELEQTVLKKLENMGIKADQSSLKKKDLTSILTRMNSKRDSVASRLPDYWSQREEIENTVEEKMVMGSDSAAESQTGSRRSAHAVQIRPRSSSLPSRTSQVTSGPSFRQPKTPQPAPRTRNSSQPKTSTPNTKTAARSFTTKTPPFSSDEESDEEEEEPQKQPRKSPVQVRASKASPVLMRQSFSSSSQQPRGSTTTKRTTVTEMESDEDAWSEVSELQEIDPRQLQGFRDRNGNVEKRNYNKENKINVLARKMEQQFAQRSAKKPAGGVSILTERRVEAQELTYTDVEESSDWVVSSLEDRLETAKASVLKKSSDSPSTSVWGTSTGKAPKSGLTEAGTGSTLKSTLCSLSDISDTEDISN